MAIFTEGGLTGDEPTRIVVGRRIVALPAGRYRVKMAGASIDVTPLDEHSIQLLAAQPPMQMPLASEQEARVPAHVQDLPLNQRVFEADMPELIEMVMGAVLTNSELRNGYRNAADVAATVYNRHHLQGV